MFYKGPLPFERGDTACGAGETPGAADIYESLVGRVYETEDADTSEPIQLLVARNISGSAITGAKKFYRFGTGQYDFGRNVLSLADAAGQVCKPMDPKLNGVDIHDHDLFYLVYGGPAEGLTETTAVSLAAHSPITTTCVGTIDGAVPAAGDFIIGRVDQNIARTGIAMRIHVSPGWSGGEGT